MDVSKVKRKTVLPRCIGLTLIDPSHRGEWQRRGATHGGLPGELQAMQFSDDRIHFAVFRPAP